MDHLQNNDNKKYTNKKFIYYILQIKINNAEQGKTIIKKKQVFVKVINQESNKVKYK